jgi:hypothetical protein
MSGNSTSGPAAAARAYYEAVLIRKDWISAMRGLSAGSIRKLEAEAKDLGKSLDVAYKELVEKGGWGCRAGHQQREDHGRHSNR